MNYFSMRPEAITIKNNVPVNLMIKDSRLVNISKVSKGELLKLQEILSNCGIQHQKRITKLDL